MILFETNILLMHSVYREFLIDVDCVTNAQFEDFVVSTNYVTEAELYRYNTHYQ